ncbi:MAG TPA: CAAX prenyl protease-related protein [Pirellulales bacterium]|jgi:hypothetical protein|nr:CAAX prenyl protease-related protein [Pirellulales bacterium]
MSFRAARSNPWLVFLLPFVVYMLAGSFEPGPPAEPGAKSAAWLDLGIEYRHYPLIYTVKILLTVAAIAYVYPGYRQFPCRASLLAIMVGVVGAVVWIALAWTQRTIQSHLGWTPGVGARSAFNPQHELASSPAWAYGFLAIRFVGLALVVPVIEEFFLRGFLTRYFVAPEWWTVPFGRVNRLAIIAGTALPVLMHPGEALAAAVWFSAVTWLMLRTRNVWDCIAAHAVTNLLLGIYVVVSGNWWLM